MTKYDIIFEELQDKVDTGELTIEDARVLNDIAFEKYSNTEIECTEASDEMEINELSHLVCEGYIDMESACEYFEITEKTGNNDKIVRAAKLIKDDIEKFMDAIKKEIKNKNYDKAHKSIDNMIEALGNIKDEVKNVNTDTADDIASLCMTVAGDISTRAYSFAIGSGIALIMSAKMDLNHIDDKEFVKSSLKEIGKTQLLIGAVSNTMRTSKFIARAASKSEKNEYKLKTIKIIDKSIKQCKNLKSAIDRKKKTSEFIEKNKKKISTAGKVAVGATAALGAAVIARNAAESIASKGTAHVAKKVLSKKEQSEEKKDDKK